jgi:hypothetical protein
MFHPRGGAWRQIRDRTRYSTKKSRVKAAFQQETNRSSGRAATLALPPIGHAAHAREAKDHHRPGGWLGDSFDRGAGNAEIVKTDHESKAGVASSFIVVEALVAVKVLVTGSRTAPFGS